MRNVFTQMLVEAKACPFYNEKQLLRYLADSEKEVSKGTSTYESIGDFFAWFYPSCIRNESDYRILGKYIADGKFRSHFSHLQVVAEPAKL